MPKCKCYKALWVSSKVTDKERRRLEDTHIQQVLLNHECICGDRDLELAVYALYATELRYIQDTKPSRPYFSKIGRRFMTYDALRKKPSQLSYETVKKLDSMKKRWEKKRVKVRIALLRDRTIALPLIGIFEPEIINSTFNTTIAEKDMPDPRILSPAMIDYMRRKLGPKDAIATQIKNVLGSKWVKSMAIKKGALSSRRNIGRKYTTFRDMILYFANKLERDWRKVHQVIFLKESQRIIRNFHESAIRAVGGKAGVRKLNQILRRNMKNRRIVDNEKSRYSSEKSMPRRKGLIASS